MSKLLAYIFKKIINEHKVTFDDINDAIDNHKRIIIDYQSKGDTSNSGARVVEVYAYGLTKTGNPVIRCFQPYGQTTTRVPSWKFFRLDRITDWQPTNQIFTKPADFYYKNLGDFNPNGDETMSIVYKIAKFDNEPIYTDAEKPTEPKTKEDVYKTDTENKMERLRQQLSNPIRLSDIKKGDAFKKIGDKEQTTVSEPKTKEDVYKTDTEKNIEKVKQQMQNPQKIDLTQFNKTPKEKSPEEKQKELDKLRDILKNNQMSLADLNRKMKEEPSQTKWQDIFNSDVEKDMKQMGKNDRINQRRRDKRWQQSADNRYLGNRKGSLNRAFDENT